MAPALDWQTSCSTCLPRVFQLNQCDSLGVFGTCERYCLRCVHSCSGLLFSSSRVLKDSTFVLFFFKFISLSFIREANIKRLQIQSAWRCQHHKDECLRIPLSGRFEDNVPRWVTKHVTEKFFFRFSRVLKVPFISRSFADILPRMMSRYGGGFYKVTE